MSSPFGGKSSPDRLAGGLSTPGYRSVTGYGLDKPQPASTPMTLNTRKPPPSATSRRRVLAGLAAAPGLALGGLSAAIAAPGALDTLLAGESTLNALSERIDAIGAEIDRSKSAAAQATGKRRPLPPIPWGREEFDRRNYYVHQSSRRYNARQDRLYAEHGYTAAVKALKDAEKQLDEIEESLRKVHATDAATLVVKARIAKRHSYISRSVIDDMLAYFGRVA
jgi:hypothetical protein